MRTRQAGKKGRVHVSEARAGRLYKLLKLVAAGTVPRETLLRKLKTGMRTFYRDIDLLRACGVVVQIRGDGYRLKGPLSDALDVLPFPDPELTFGDVESLMRGRTPTHAKIRQLFLKITK